ncbi:Trk family potassium uptake protein [Thermanaerosceptrum fracticalcis]|uniref:Trk family potassium uptake protein n=1 Tax=Thermanaerosceptrum fracticalcis TaxID=1712410 RepID=A0A7G6DZL0_THEFR|nr:TrkH family potassium uptake protein [Thermanaerosceptrum fracticalcis]QNB45264.1 Trk family potassium uptake protein [Thermanaerosceptrum fracticalcis]
MKNKTLELTPPQIISLGFIFIIGTGTILLALPLASRSGIGLSLIDALFTATSATAVTGLVVVDTGTYFNLFGQLVILFMIQIGGLGFMTITTLFALALGKRINLRERLIMQEALNKVDLEGVVKLTKYIIIFTFLTEGLAALVLTLYWAPLYGWGQALYYGLFHAISAFNNAGFDLFTTSMVRFRGDWLVNLVIMFLIITGGLGFTVIADIYNNGFKWREYSLHTKLVLVVTACLLVVGAAGVYVLEKENPDTLKNLPFHERLLASLFQGVVPRTAGFNSVMIGQLRSPTLFLMMILMFIGASPGSTGGGIKTTTFITIVLTVYYRILGREDTPVFNRRLPTDTIFKSLSVMVVGVLLVIVVAIMLLAIENKPLEPVLFETVSAFATVGLSTGITSQLTPAGKLLLTLMMFTGRVGPMTVAYAIVLRKTKTTIRMPEEKIIVG